MSLERLYYNDPFSNIVISCDFYYAESPERLNKALGTAIECFESLSLSFSVDDNGCLRYSNIGHKKNLDNILFSDLDEASILKLLAGHTFDLQNGETLKIIIQTKEFGYTIFFCMHHIIGDAYSLALLVKKFIALLQNTNISIVEMNNSPPNSSIELDWKTMYLISTINKQYPCRHYSRNDYLSMHYQLYNDNNLEISKVILNENEFLEISDFCKSHDVSITSYIISEIFRVQNVETVCLPVDTREARNIFGNFVGRIDISRKRIEKESDILSRATIINKDIKSMLANKNEMDKGVETLNLIHPGFYDDVIFDAYSNFSNPFAKKMTKLIGYKDTKQTTFVSNLKIVDFNCKENFRISNLSFYPPHPVERFSTIGIVTQNEQMIITIQKFRGKKTL